MLLMVLFLTCLHLCPVTKYLHYSYVEEQLIYQRVDLLCLWNVQPVTLTS